jgi:hypothetical protein
MREFITSAQNGDVEPTGEEQTIKIDGREVTFRSPNPSQIVLIVAAIESSAQSVSLAAAMINAFFSIIKNPADASHLRGRLFDSEDAFDMVNIAEIMSALMEEWSGKATPPSSEQSSSQPPTGRTSRATHSGQAFHRGPSHRPNGAPSSSDGSAVALRPTQSDSTPSSES